MADMTCVELDYTGHQAIIGRSSNKLSYMDISSGKIIGDVGSAIPYTLGSFLFEFGAKSVLYIRLYPTVRCTDLKAKQLALSLCTTLPKPSVLPFVLKCSVGTSVSTCCAQRYTSDTVVTAAGDRFPPAAQRGD
jgi:hypothetical protein